MRTAKMHNHTPCFVAGKLFLLFERTPPPRNFSPNYITEISFNRRALTVEH
jgi:hypothetical protein